MKDSAAFKEVRSEVIGEFNQKAVSEGLFEQEEKEKK